MTTLLLAFAFSLYFTQGKADSENLGPYPVSLEELIADGSEFIGKEVSVSAYLMIDNGMHLFPTIEAFDAFDFHRSVNILSKNSSEVPEKFSGCMINVIGTVKSHQYKKSIVVLDDIREIGRTGALYIQAKDKMESEGISGEPKCLGQALVDILAKSHKR